MTAPGDRAVATDAPAPTGRRRRLFAAGALVVALAVAAIVWGSADWGSTEPQAAPTATPTAVPELTTAEVYEALAPSVVTIESLDAGTNRATGSGTGVIANADALIVTAWHVVDGAGSIRVTFFDGTDARATVVGADPATDIAILAPMELPTVVVPAVIGSSGRLAIGDGVIAIGNQLGLTASATVGVVSGLNRAATGRNGNSLSGLIQFDAAVNPGSSGGPLVNTKGETVGIVVALANPTEAGTFIGIGFAVPIGTALGAGGDGPGPQQ